METIEIQPQRGIFDAFTKDSLIQPNSVTNAVYHYSKAQENILTCIIKTIQNHITKETPIQTDLFGQPVVRIQASQVGKNKSQVLRELIKLRKKDIYYSY